jgi:hypothetical protein
MCVVKIWQNYLFFQVNPEKEIYVENKSSLFSTDNGWNERPAQKAGETKNVIIKYF